MIKNRSFYHVSKKRIVFVVDFAQQFQMTWFLFFGLVILHRLKAVATCNNYPDVLRHNISVICTLSTDLHNTSTDSAATAILAGWTTFFR